MQRDGLRIRYRVDGLLRDVTTAPKRLGPSIISRVKIMSGLDIAERRLPQDGRSRIVVDGISMDTRVSTLPSLHGEKVVIRLLTRAADVPSLESLGFEPDQLAAFLSALAVPQGLVLITGPTGSGKTNTLYAAISQTMTPDKNIVTLEDPIEVQLAGITQVQVNEKSGLTFDRGLRSILRQDPDVVLVGEVRDALTAELALKASLTGHLVLTTLHTNSAVSALTRLVDMGVEPFLVASSLTAAVAQRLVRRPCDSCAEGYIPDDSTLALLGLHVNDILDATPRKGTGCPDCAGSGYRGRTAVYEVLEVDAAMRTGAAHLGDRVCRRRAGAGDGNEDAAGERPREGQAGRDDLRRSGAGDAHRPLGRAPVPVVPAGCRQQHAAVPLVRRHPRRRQLRELRATARAGLDRLPLVPPARDDRPARRQRTSQLSSTSLVLGRVVLTAEQQLEAGDAEAREL
jgi:type II secretory ATPase GspE/PulE/Tfp pilus assembly ATPase PilB-like protein